MKKFEFFLVPAMGVGDRRYIHLAQFRLLRTGTEEDLENGYYYYYYYGMPCQSNGVNGVNGVNVVNPSLD